MADMEHTWDYWPTLHPRSQAGRYFTLLFELLLTKLPPSNIITSGGGMVMPTTTSGESHPIDRVVLVMLAEEA